MNKFYLIILIFLVSCSSNNIRKNFDFSHQMNFEEFKIKLEEYAKNNPYPNIDD
tara:strand:+ start:322 stop:483 length:162 start_codon:yes stop_codon:yes gene_type:complete